MLVAVPDQRPVVISKVWPSHVYVRVWTFDGVVAESVALAARDVCRLQMRNSGTGRNQGAERCCDQYEPLHAVSLLLGVSQSKTPEL